MEIWLQMNDDVPELINSYIDGDDNLEIVANIIHQQWMDYTKGLMQYLGGTTLSTESIQIFYLLRNKFKPNWIDYKDLPEHEKEKDRKIARQILEAIS